MKLIITDTIRKAELDPLIEIFPFTVIAVAAKKAIQGLGKTIKSVSTTSLKYRIFLLSSGLIRNCSTSLASKAKSSVAHLSRSSCLNSRAVEMLSFWDR
jgi:galactitol-specific phosphotransferase system IIC component